MTTGAQAPPLPPVIVYGSTPWEAAWLTEHQLAHQLAARTSVLYVEPPQSPLSPLRFGLRPETLRDLRRLARRVRRHGRMVVVAPVAVPPVSSTLAQRVSRRLVARQVRRALRELPVTRPPVALSTNASDALWRAAGERATAFLIKDLNDAGAELLGVDADRMRSVVAAMAARSEMTIVISEPLRATMAGRGIESRVLRHGFDAELARAYDAADEPQAYENLPRPLLGYTGRIDARLDLTALAAVAERFERGSVILLGPVSPLLDERALDDLRRRSNVTLLPAVSRECLPPYVAHLDCCLLPYRQSEWLAHGSPLKLWDYLGAGPPIAGSGVAVLRDYPPPLVHFADPPAQLALAVEAALTTAANPAGRDARREFALANSWSERADTLSGWLDEIAPDRAAPGAR